MGAGLDWMTGAMAGGLRLELRFERTGCCIPSFLYFTDGFFDDCGGCH